MIQDEKVSLGRVEFIDDDHEIVVEFYDLLQIEMEINQFKRKLRAFIKKDPLFFDPYLLLADILSAEGSKESQQKAKALLKDGYEKALNQITNENGDWPQVLGWGYLNNRHLIRMIDRWGFELWDDGKTDEALDIFRKLLKSNPSDNLGARYSILAMKMGLDSNYEAKFQSKIPGYIDAYKINWWFNKNSIKYWDEFAWWWKEQEKKSGKLYQLKIWIKDIQPPVWRRILISSDSRFNALHDSIQKFFGWHNCHLHEFYFHNSDKYNKRCRILGLNPDGSIDVDADLDEYESWEDKIYISEVLNENHESVNYIYDFGDNWHLLIRLERSFPLPKRFMGAVCVGGKRAAPPEDCGGAKGYQEMLDILTDPNHPDYKETLEWLGREFDPENMGIKIQEMTPKQIAEKYSSNSFYPESTSKPPLNNNGRIDSAHNEKKKSSPHQFLITGRSFRQIFQTYLHERSNELKSASFRAYEDVIGLLEHYLDRYGFNYLTEEEMKNYDEKAENGTRLTFCKVFGHDFLERFSLIEFLDYFVVYKVLGSKSNFNSIPRVLRHFVKWLHEKGGIDDENRENQLDIISDFKDYKLPDLILD